MISTHRIMPASHTRQWWLAGGIHPSQVVAAYQPKGAVDLAASYVNLANPGTNDAQAGVAPTIGADGWVFNGTTQYLDTGVAPNNANSFIAVRFSRANTSVGLQNIAGSAAAGDTRFYMNPVDNAAYSFGIGTRIIINGSYLVSGVMCIASSKGYINGVQVASGSFPGNTNPISIGASYNGTNVVFFYAGLIQAVVIGNATLTSAQVAALSAAMAAL